MSSRHLILATTALGASLAASTVAHAVPAIGLLGGTSLFGFDTTTPGVATGTTAITGLSSGERLYSIDYRPTTGALYALGTTGSLYTINSTTGLATLASTLSTGLSGSDFDISFNPTVDRLRVVSNSGQNLRVNVDTGAVTMDGTLAYAAGDAAAGRTPSIVGAGYTNQVSGTVATTTLYDLDATAATLVTQAPPNNGTLNTVGALGVANVLSFEIDGTTSLAYAATNSGFYRVNLSNGAASLVGGFSTGGVTDFALTPASVSVPEPMSLTLLGLGVAALATVRRRNSTRPA